MRRRLDLAATLVARPEVLFLDEPTTGLDPRARNELWDVLDTLVGQGTTILLTTQYLEEAERLADDIVVVDHGRVIARGDARSSSARSAATSCTSSSPIRATSTRSPSCVERVAGTRPAVDVAERSVDRADRRRRRGDRRAGERARRRRRSRSRTSACASRRSTTCSSP